jgi:excinuclease ABC subunit C
MSSAGSARSTSTSPLQEKIKTLPREPGVYLFRDRTGNVLYIGKAQNLRARVRSYFVRSGDQRYRMSLLVPRIDEIEFVATTNAKEALLLENQLIKEHRPRFNVRLRDDKNYLGLRLDPKQSYPRLTEVRRFLRDGALYFGPYTSSVGLRETLSQQQKIFPLRTCSDSVFRGYQRQGRPCLEHAVGRCAAPCCGLISDEAYRRLVDGTILFLRGKARELAKDLRAQMRDAAKSEQFEEAARLRDLILAIERTVQRQSMVSAQFVDRDVFGLARDGSDFEVQILHVRQGRLLGGDKHSFRNIRIDDAEALGSFLAQFYERDRDLPREVLLPLRVEGQTTLQDLWRERAGHAVRAIVPQRGERRRLVELAQHNAELALAERSQREQKLEETLAQLQKLLRLRHPPARIECYDVSHLQGTMHVASRVVFVDGEPYRDGYRRYKLREAEAGDDYGAMREVLRRRLARLEQDPAPDVVLLDGGKGQLNAVEAVLRDLGVGGIALASLAKERDLESPSPRVKRHAGSKREKLFLSGVKDPLLPQPEAPAFLLLQRIRDESHRFAIRYHRELRSKSGLRSILDELPGIGPVKRRALLRGLGSLERVKRASVEELAGVPKVSRVDAELIHRFFRAEVTGASVKRRGKSSDPSPS